MPRTDSRSAVSLVAFPRSLLLKLRNPFTTPVQHHVARPLAEHGFSSILEF